MPSQTKKNKIIENLFDAKFTTTDVKKLGIKRERLKEWMSKGFVQASVKASGPGTKNLFSLLDLYQIKLFAYVVDCGFSREEAAFRTGVFSRAQETLRDETYTTGLGQACDIEQKKALGTGLAGLAEAPFIALHKKRNEKDGEQFRLLYDGQQFDLDRYRDSDYILIINFKKIRLAIDSALG